MNSVLLPVLTFGATFMLIGGVYSIVADLYLRDRSRVSRRIDDEFRKQQRERVKSSSLFKDLNQLATMAAAEQGKLTMRQRLEVLIEQAGGITTPQKLATISMILAVGLSGLTLLIVHQIWVILLVAPIGATLPLLWLIHKRNARLAKMLEQLPDAYDLMARVIRAGQTMSQAIQSVSEEFPQPIAGEFSYCFEQQNLGLPPETTMRELARRTGLLEMRIFVTALLVQQQTGGNLAELLEKIAGLIRQRERTRGQIQTLTAEGRMQAIVLLGMPFLMFALMMAMNSPYECELLRHPKLICGTLLFEGAGAVWIRRIVNFDF